jgi:large-conductance mechanosensitive channel
MNTKPKLIETGTKYFLKETLKKVHKEKTTYDNTLFNVFLFLIFVFIAFFILNYKYKTKPNELEKKKKDDLKKNYILNKIKQLNDKQKKEYDKMITNLPKFESNFEMLHKKFYNV